MSVQQQQKNKNTFYQWFNNLKVLYKIGLGFMFFFFLIAISFSLMKYYQGIGNKEFHIMLNIAGKNRTLSQKIAINAEQLIKGNENVEEELILDLKLHANTINVLKNGGTPMGMPSSIVISSAPEYILPKIEEIEKIWISYKKNTETIIEAKNVRVAINYIGKTYNQMLFLDSEMVHEFITYYNKNGKQSNITNEIINSAGKNRMLSQRIGLISQRIFSNMATPKELTELARAVSMHQSSLTILKKGGILNGLKIPKAPVEIIPAIEKTENLWRKYKQSTEVILRNTKSHNAMTFIEQNSSALLHANNLLVEALMLENKTKSEDLRTKQDTIFWLVLVLITLSFMYVGFMIVKYVSTPLKMLTQAASEVSTGDISTTITYQSKDEVGIVATSINQLIAYLKDAAEFSMAVGEGNFDKDFELKGKNDTLGVALTDMRNKLNEVTIEDKKRSWSTIGMAKFADILRSNDNSIDELSNQIIINLVKYGNANQGNIFIVNNEKKSDLLELKASYAWNRKKHYEKTIELGEGLAGQCWQEGEYIYLTDIPSDYVTITSGLGETTPKSLLLIPLKLEKEVFGIIEMASLKNFEPHQIEFFLKLGESIATTISNVKTSENTTHLLEESKVMTEQLQAQEEEMRQNMEEMQATQEELERASAEFKGQLNVINNAILISKTDKKGYITYVNDVFCETAGYSREELIGQNHNIVRHPDTSKDTFKEIWTTIGKGKIWKGKIKNKKKGGGFYWVMAVIGPVIGNDGKPKEYIGVRTDITEMMQNREEA